MKRTLILTVFGLLVAGCNQTGKPIEFANVCDKANDKQNIEVVGYFLNTGSAMCSKSGKDPMRCPIGFADKADNPRPAMTNIDLGSGASSVENVEGKGLTIRDDKKQDVSNTDKVKIVASLRVYDAPGDNMGKYLPCSLTVKKIEKVP
ncbi:MAG: hypothetical protein IPJ30_00200 [Acidobacteria bacterium]|nr:hypothetical protein [Acidobacteriota bacterium]